MTETINQGPNGDITLELVDGVESVRQRVSQRLQMFRGEYYLDTRAGVPYIDDILRHNFDEELAIRVISDSILDVTDVTGVSDVVLSYDADSRTLTFSATIQTLFGRTSVGGAI